MKILVSIVLFFAIFILYLWCKASNASRKAEPINGVHIKDGKIFYNSATIDQLMPEGPIEDDGPDEFSPENLDVDSIHERLRLRNQADVDLDYSREDGK